MAKKKRSDGSDAAPAVARPDPLFAATENGNAKFDLGDRVHATEDIRYSDTTIKTGSCGTIVEVHELIPEAFYGVFFDGDVLPKRLVRESRLGTGCSHD